MIRLIDHGVFLTKQGDIIENKDIREKDEGRKKTMAYGILQAHNKSGDMENLKLTFDALVSPDNNYVNILQTARAGGGRMILGSDSHTRYGALGTMGIGEGGGEVAKQLLGRTYDVKMPPVLAVRLTGSPRPGVGPQDVALALVAATFKNNFNKNKILEFVGPGIRNLSMEYRMGIDVMTTESAALSSIWCTDERTREYLREHGREDAYQKLMPEDGVWYDGLIDIDLSQVECMIALPFHPSNALPIREFQERMEEILEAVEEEGQKIKGPKGKPFSIMSHVRDGGFYVDQALVSGCSGGLFENIVAMADILKGYGIPGNGLNLGVNPASLPVMAELMRQGIAGELAVCGVTLRPAICGPCFGVTDVPADNQVSIRHMTRNYPNREGSKPGQGQMAAACLMDARSIAATVRNGGRLTAATELSVEYRSLTYHFDEQIYKNQVFDNFGKGDAEEKLVMGPNIADWPEMAPLRKHLLLRVAGSYEGSVTTDELIPSGEASSFRSNPEKISEYTMISRDKDYVGRAKAVREMERQRQAWAAAGRMSEKPGTTENQDGAYANGLKNILSVLCTREQCGLEDILIGSAMVSQQIGDGSSREQAASCQKVLGGFANIANEYATKRYRSNLINWGILPLRTEKDLKLPTDTWIFIRNIRQVIEEKQDTVKLQILSLPEEGGVEASGTLECTLDNLTEDERKILLAGSLINYYKG